MKNTYYTVNHPIDFVVTWLDSSDKVWQKDTCSTYDWFYGNIESII